MPDPVVDPYELAMVQQEYLKRYFTPKPVIPQEQAHARSLAPARTVYQPIQRRVKLPLGKCVCFSTIARHLPQPDNTYARLCVYALSTAGNQARCIMAEIRMLTPEEVAAREQKPTGHGHVGRKRSPERTQIIED